MTNAQRIARNLITKYSTMFVTVKSKDGSEHLGQICLTDAKRLAVMEAEYADSYDPFAGDEWKDVVSEILKKS